MNNAHSLYSVFALLFVLNLPVVANDLVSFPAGPAAWTIELTDSPSNKEPSHGGIRIMKIEATQNNEFLRSVVMYSNNTTRENWSILNSPLFLSEDPRGTPFVTSPSRVFFVPFLPSCFDWIESAYLQEKTPIEYEDKSCFHYKGPMSTSPTNGPGLPDQTFLGEAWIDSKTLQPVALDDGIYLAIYTFHSSPDDPLIVPPKYKKLYDRYKAVMGIPKNN